MKDIYNNSEYLLNNPDWHESDSKYKAEKIINILEGLNFKIKSIAEVGCGAGGIIKILSEKYKDIKMEGYDISRNAIDLAKPKESHNLKFYNKDILKTDSFFDLILLIDVFEHVKNYFEFIEEISKHSKYIIFHVPLEMTLLKILFPKRLIKNRKNTGHLHYFSKETVLETLKDANLEIIDYKYTKWGIEMKQKGILKKVGRIFLFILNIFGTDFATRIMGGSSLLVFCSRKDLYSTSTQ